MVRTDDPAFLEEYHEVNRRCAYAHRNGLGSLTDGQGPCLRCTLEWAGRVLLIDGPVSDG